MKGLAGFLENLKKEQQKKTENSQNEPKPESKSDPIPKPKRKLAKSLKKKSKPKKPVTKSNLNDHKSSKIEAFVQIKNPKMTNYFELLQEQAKPEEIKILSQQVKKRRTENRRMTGHVLEMEKALRNFEIRQERERRKRAQDQKKSILKLKDVVEGKGMIGQGGMKGFLNKIKKHVIFIFRININNSKIFFAIESFRIFKKKSFQNSNLIILTRK